jgi:hypothetical protein
VFQWLTFMDLLPAMNLFGHDAKQVHQFLLNAPSTCSTRTDTKFFLRESNTQSY